MNKAKKNLFNFMVPNYNFIEEMVLTIFSYYKQKLIASWSLTVI